VSHRAIPDSHASFVSRLDVMHFSLSPQRMVKGLSAMLLFFVFAHPTLMISHRIIGYDIY
jgi:hypothetical protein